MKKKTYYYFNQNSDQDTVKYIPVLGDLLRWFINGRNYGIF